MENNHFHSKMLAGPFSGALIALSLVTSIMDLAMGPKKSKELQFMEKKFDETIGKLNEINKKIDELQKTVKFEIKNAAFVELVSKD